MGAEDDAPSVTPGDLGLSEPGVTVMHIAEPERDRLRALAAELGGPSTLLHFDDADDGGIEITKAHPGSLPQFITGPLDAAVEPLPRRGGAAQRAPGRRADHRARTSSCARRAASNR